MKKKLLIAIATILLVFIIGIVHINTEQIAFWEVLFGTEYTPVFKEQELKVPTDGNAACVQENVDFKEGIYVVEDDSVDKITGVEEKEKMMAYITYKMINEGGADYANRTGTPEYAYNARQEAIWAIMNDIEGKTIGDKHGDDGRYYRLVDTDAKKYQGGTTGPTEYEYSSAPGFVKLYCDAKDYATKSNQTAKVETASGNLISGNSNTTKITGPYRITFGADGELKDILLGGSVSVSQESKDKVWICDDKGEPKQIKSGEDFYIAIDTTKVDIAFATANKVTLNYNWNEYKLTVQETLRRKENAEGTDQRIAYFEAEKEEKTTTLTLNLPKIIPPIEVSFKKVDTAGNPLSGIEFEFYKRHKVTYEDKIIDKLVSQKHPETGEEGWIILKHYPTDLEHSFFYKEIFINGYDDYSEIYSKFKYNGGFYLSISWKEERGKWEGRENYIIKNTPIVENLTITKKDSETGQVLNGAKFNITLENVSSIMGYSSTGGSKIILKDVSQEKYAKFMEGILKLERLVIADQTKPITITIEEAEAPLGYKKLDGKIVLTLQRVDEKGNVENNKALRYLQLTHVKVEGNISADEFDVNQFGTLPKNLDDHAISLDIKNIPVMNIGGVVWEDKIVDGKTAQKNNKYDENAEEFEGIRVELWEGDSFKEFTTTDASGKYLFKEVVKSDNYKVVFIYDGMTYETVKDSSDNVAEEVGRDSFNNKFKTINSETTVDEQKLWSEEYYASYNDETVKTKLETLESTADNVKNPKTIFKMTAQVKVKDHLDDNGIDATNINCGLTDRYFDLALGLDVSTATVAINGKSTTYTYEQILTASEIENAKENASEYLSMRLDKEGNLNKDANGNDVEYNLYLYESDYNYRIDDYKHGLPNNYNPTDNARVSEKAENYLPLEVYVTYKAIVYNQSSEKGYATKVINKYDPNIYTIVPNENIDPYSEAGKAIITLEKPEEGTRTQEIEITYKVNKDADGYLSLKDGDMANNKVEIYEYFSERGIVDYDSVPGNDREKEDDIDSALPLNVIVKDEERTITGIVFDDIDKDGNYKDNNLVNDVIVQLIELKEIDGIIYEYIWQETVSGRNTVKTTNRNGYPGNTYINTVAENGKYEFTGFIPGNYRVRFIYGDGTTYDLTQNVIDYNGQDYKSTYFKDETENYKKEWYNDTVYVGDTKAIDNEARRLETMAYSVNTDNLNKMEVLDEEITASTEEATKTKINEVLSNTWMCAETAKINVLVDTDDITSINSEQQNVTPKEEGLKIEEINLGLMKRIEAQISLEKHITALEVQIGGVTESKASIPDEHLEALMAGEIDSFTDPKLDEKVAIGSTIGLKLDSVASRRNRGSWSIEVPTNWEHIVNDTKFSVTYTYIVKNTSNEQDYLSNVLMESYINYDLSAYINQLNGYASAMKFQRTMPEYQNSMSGMYLSNFYYTGQSGESKVTSRVEEIEEIVNPKIKYSAGDFIDKPHSEPYTIYDINGNKINGNKDGTNPTVKITTNTRTESLDIGDFANFEATFLKENLTEGSSTNYHSYIAQISKYSNATGRRLSNSIPGNLEYVHSDDERIVIEDEDYNELDEFWGETVKITPKAGDDKQTPMQITIIVVSAVAIVGVGIILIKKFVLKK